MTIGFWQSKSLTYETDFSAGRKATHTVLLKRFFALDAATQIHHVGKAYLEHGQSSIVMGASDVAVQVVRFSLRGGSEIHQFEAGQIKMNS